MTIMSKLVESDTINQNTVLCANHPILMRNFAPVKPEPINVDFHGAKVLHTPFLRFTKPVQNSLHIETNG